MTVRDILEVMQVDCYVSIWTGIQGNDLIAHGTVEKLYTGDDETLPMLDDETLDNEVVFIDTFRSSMSRFGVQTAITI